MGQKHTPFSLTRQAKRLLVAGYMDGAAEVRQVLSRQLADVKGAGKKFIVDASDSHVTPAGLSMWIEVVGETLQGVALHYTDSQLADLLQLDDRALHPGSTFEGSDLTTNLPPNPIKLPTSAPHQPPPRRRKALAW